MADEKTEKPKNKGRRKAFADKVRAKYPTHLGVDTNKLSNTYCKKIGKTHGMSPVSAN